MLDIFGTFDIVITIKEETLALRPGPNVNEIIFLNEE